MLELLESAATVSNPFDIEEASVAQLQSAMAHNQLSALALVDYYLARIERLDGQLNSLITINPKAKATAKSLDRERANGKVRSPLHGIPIVVKDNIDTADMPTTGGCSALATLQPPDDAFVVARLKEAGAIILAKANLHELAQRGESVSGLGGQVRNPYNLDYTPGGSSGGSAVAVAANLAALALGTDTVNSVRSPASACNIVGMRPTAGRVSRNGLMPVALSHDVIGPMGRTVSDVATLLSVIAVDDPEDPMTARSTGVSTDYKTSLKKKGLKGMRLGIVPSLFGQGDDCADNCAAVNQLMESAIATMESLGAQRCEVAAVIDIDQLINELSLTHWEFRTQFNQYLERVGERVGKPVEEPAGEGVGEGVEEGVGKSMGGAAPVKDLTALIKSGRLHPSIKAQLETANQVKSPLGDGEYWQRLYPRRVELRQTITQLFQRYQLNALVYPHQRIPVAAIGEPQQGRNGFLAAASGFPAITVPAGFIKEGLPVGIELMGLAFQEHSLLKMAYAYEQETSWRSRPNLPDAPET